MRILRFIRLYFPVVLDIAGALLLGSSLAATLALVVPIVAPVMVPAVSAQTISPEVPLSQTVSHNWSGYVAQGKEFTAVGGSWVVPTPQASTTATIMPQADATWVGIGGVSSSDLIQAGTQAIVHGGQTQYEAWVETLPGFSQPLPITISGGDSVTVSLTQTSPGIWHLDFTDNTTGQNYQTDIQYDSSNSSAEWIEEMPVGLGMGMGGGYIPLDAFGSVSFSNGWTTGDGTHYTVAGSGAVPLTMGLSQAQLLATPTPLSSDGSSFTVNRSALALDTTTPTSVTTGMGRRHHDWSVTQVVTPITQVTPQSDGGGYTITMVIPFGFFGGF